MTVILFNLFYYILICHCQIDLELLCVGSKGMSEHIYHSIPWKRCELIGWIGLPQIERIRPRISMAIPTRKATKSV